MVCDVSTERIWMLTITGLGCTYWKLRGMTVTRRGIETGPTTNLMTTTKNASSTKTTESSKMKTVMNGSGSLARKPPVASCHVFYVTASTHCPNNVEQIDLHLPKRLLLLNPKLEVDFRHFGRTLKK